MSAASRSFNASRDRIVSDDDDPQASAGGGRLGVVSELDEFRYAKSGDVSIAYAVYGDGPRDLVFVHGAVSNIEIERETPEPRAFQDRFAGFSRLIMFDKRGTGSPTGCASRPRSRPAWTTCARCSTRPESERAVLFGTAEAAAMCTLFAATYPDRTLGLALFAPFAKGTWAPDYPWGDTPEEWRQAIADETANWGTYAASRGDSAAPGSRSSRRRRVHHRPRPPLTACRRAQAPSPRSCG